MKKTLIALAAVAATGAAMAQSSVTISGAFDLGFVRNGAAGTTALDTSNGLSQIVFSGTEDLGGGLKANFALQQRFSLEGGNNDGTAAGRRTYQGASTVGLSGGFGNVRLGREVEAFNDWNNYADPWGTVRTASTAFSYGWAGNSLSQNGGDIGRTDGIHYESPSFGGFRLAATYGLKDQTAAALGTLTAGGATPATVDAHIALAGVYSGGPVTVGAAYQSNRTDETSWAVFGGYNFGAAEVRVGYQKSELNAGGFNAVSAAAVGDYKAYNLGLIVPMGATTLMAGYLRQDTAGVKTNKFGLGATYALSKRTSVGANMGKVKNVSANYDVFLRHTF